MMIPSQPTSVTSRLRICVVGAGMSGLTAARVLSHQGHDVVVVDKARGPGGRMSTRRIDDLRFDHGAQYFTARDPHFSRHVTAWLNRGLVCAWDARIATIGDRPMPALEQPTMPQGTRPAQWKTWRRPAAWGTRQGARA